jgi:hypothetical protein
MNETAAKVATAKAIDDKSYKLLTLDLPQGITLIDTRVRLVGTLKKSAPYMQRIAAAADPWALLARALSKLNSATIDSLVEESLAVDGEEKQAIKDAAEAAIERIRAATEREVPGRVTAALQWELLS